MSTTKTAASMAGDLGVRAPKTPTEAGYVRSLWNKILGTSPGAWIHMRVRQTTSSVKGFLARLARFARPVTNRLTKVWNWVRGQMSGFDMATGTVFMMLTYRGRHWLTGEDGVLAKAYAIASWAPKKIGTGIRRVIGRWGWGQSISERVARYTQVAEFWVASKVVDGAAYLDAKHSAVPTRIVRNASWMTLVVRLSRFIPHPGLRFTVRFLAFFATTSEVVHDGDVYTDGPAFLVADGFMRGFGPKDVTKPRAQRATKSRLHKTSKPAKSEKDAQAAAGASNQGPGSTDTTGTPNGSEADAGKPGNREERRAAEAAEKKLASAAANGTGRQRS